MGFKIKKININNKNVTIIFLYSQRGEIICTIIKYHYKRVDIIICVYEW